jgi:hypothetical protein
MAALQGCFKPIFLSRWGDIQRSRENVAKSPLVERLKGASHKINREAIIPMAGA